MGGTPVDDDDDTHFCLKCRQTIIGLDTYVAHRRANCQANTSSSNVPSSSHAVDFFSSLELQSSNKKPTKPKVGVLTRRKAAQQANPPSSDIQSKAVSTTDTEPQPQQSLWADDDIVDEDEELFSDDDDTRPPRSHTGGKWKPGSSPPPSYTGGKWKPYQSTKPMVPIQTRSPCSGGTNSQTSLIPPPSYTKGKWKPNMNNGGGAVGSGQQAPPPTHTKGKWRLEQSEQFVPPPTDHTKGKWKPDNELLPPSTYTKGKWRPATKRTASKLLYEDFSFVKSSGAVHYWCKPCNRRLSSRIVYERHLKSDLHRSRTQHDTDFDWAVSVPNKRKRTNKAKEITAEVEPSTKILKRKPYKRVYTNCDVCHIKVAVRLIGKHLISHYHWRRSNNMSTKTSKSMILDNMHSIVHQSPFQCAPCKYYFNQETDFLNHWLSKPHAMKVVPSLNFTTGNVCSYLWCSYCKFKCTNNDTMLEHLTSAEHGEVVAVINRSVPIVIRLMRPANCTECRAQFTLNIELLKHCRIENHEFNKISANRYCQECRVCFRSRLSLKLHQQKEHQKRLWICTPCDMTFSTKEEALVHRKTGSHRLRYYQHEKNHRPNNAQTTTRNCQYCSTVIQSMDEFKEHMKCKHRDMCCKCANCGSIFALVRDLRQHQRSNACICSIPKQEYACEKCAFSSDGPAQLLFHRAVIHSEPLVCAGPSTATKSSYKYKCPLCSSSFPKSSLEGHLRNHTNEKPFRCGVCGLKFARKNNWLFHMKNQHLSTSTQPLNVSFEKADRLKTPAAISNASASCQNIHEVANDNDDNAVVGERSGSLKNPQSDSTTNCSTSVNKEFLCSVCGASFMRKSALKQHMTVHSGKKYKCPRVSCAYEGRCAAELKEHYQIHFTERQFTCPICDYKSKTQKLLKRHLGVHESEKRFKCPKCSFTARQSTHLKRHFRIHTGAKPYRCPYCAYKCNNVENLRKHILSTNLHAGKYMYECKFCSDQEHAFRTNYERDYRVHLIQQHSNCFENLQRISAFVSAMHRINVREEIKEDVTVKEDVISEEEVDSEIGKLNVVILTGQEEDQNPIELIRSDLDPLSKEEVTWIAHYDVGESGALTPFTNESEVLFDHHFQ